jgi:hypothetical protein
MELIIHDTFPREFRRRLSQSLDQELLIIILATAILLVSWLLFMLRHLPAEAQAEAMFKYQKTYASMILAHEAPVVSLKTDGLAVVPALASAATERTVGASEAGEGRAGAGSGRGGSGRGGAGSGAESRLPTTAEMANAGRGGNGRAGYYGGASMSSMESEVGNVGVLGVLTSGSGYGGGDYISGLDGEAGAQSQRLQEVLDGLDGVQVGQYAGTGAGGSGRGRGDKAAGERSLRGTRRESRALSIDDLLGSLQPTGHVQFKEVDRNAEYEPVSNNIDQKPGIPRTAEEKAKLQRNARHVQSVVNGHRPAIIDCYKQLLRTQPTLKGRVDVRFAIDAEGRVIWAEITDATISNQTMLDCILNRIRQWNDFGYGDPTVKEEVFRQSYTFGY